ncbi:hypothetical protein FIV42_09340 [Persicimonas caeni]|uniref:Uncharacterized protein n=1 Tax=Persicimonas caeni TaxID=2292766 RepID=A0A4Y6PS36_PERCE|nr:hypothetical protein [Persicimonas caeni]QDG50929.1 hypothetical protein FIV42_09340 [Persicimonas caeni]QED32150.1 hypothetical protein FRD00_09335 [Persicimonas caeni]
MADKIDGGDSSRWGFDMFDGALDTLEGAASDAKKSVEDAVGDAGEQIGDAIGDAQKQIEDAVGDAEEDIGEAAEEFWDGVSGAAQQAVDEVERSVMDEVDEASDFAVETAEELEQVLDLAHEALHEMGEVPKDVVAGGEELYRTLENQGAKLADEVEAFLESQPEEAVYEAAERVFDGTVNLGREMLETVEQDVYEPLKSLPETLSENAKHALVGMVLTGADTIVEHRELIEGAGEFVEQVLDNERAAYAFKQAGLDPVGLAISFSRTAMLGLARGAKGAPGLAQDLIDHPDKVRMLVEDLDPNDVQPEIEALEVGNSYVIQRGLEVSAHAKVGGVVGASVESSVTRLDADRYEVEVSLKGTVGVGGGVEAAGEGATGDNEVELGGKIVVEVSGPGAAERAAQMATAPHGNFAALLRKTPSTDIDVSEAEGSFADDLDVEVFDVGAKVGIEGTASLTTIDGQKYYGKTASVGLKFEAKSPSLQIGDDLARPWLESSKVGHPLLDEMFEKLPPEIPQGFKEVYGPTVGINLAAEPKATVGFYTPVGAEQPIRVTYDVDMTLRVGRSEIDANIGVTITDLHGLAKALGKSGLELQQQLASGEVTVEGLMNRADDLGADVDRFVDVNGPTLEMSKEDMTGIDGVLGVTMRQGTVDNYVLWSPDDRDFIDNFKRAVAVSDDENRAEADSLRSKHLNAHAIKA